MMLDPGLGKATILVVTLLLYHVLLVRLLLLYLHTLLIILIDEHLSIWLLERINRVRWSTVQQQIRALTLLGSCLLSLK